LLYPGEISVRFGGKRDRLCISRHFASARLHCFDADRQPYLLSLSLRLLRAAIESLRFALCHGGNHGAQQVSHSWFTYRAWSEKQDGGFLKRHRREVDE